MHVVRLGLARGVARPASVAAAATASTVARSDCGSVSTACWAARHVPAASDPIHRRTARARDRLAAVPTSPTRQRLAPVEREVRARRVRLVEPCEAPGRLAAGGRRHARARGVRPRPGGVPRARRAATLLVERGPGRAGSGARARVPGVSSCSTAPPAFASSQSAKRACSPRGCPSRRDGRRRRGSARGGSAGRLAQQPADVGSISSLRRSDSSRASSR